MKQGSSSRKVNEQARQILADILDALSNGIARGASLIVIYLFAIQLFESIRFVFG